MSAGNADEVSRMFGAAVCGRGTAMGGGPKDDVASAVKATMSTAAAVMPISADVVCHRTSYDYDNAKRPMPSSVRPEIAALFSSYAVSAPKK